MDTCIGDSGDGRRTTWPERLAWLSIPLFLVATAVVYRSSSESIFESPVLLTELNTLFCGAVSLLIVYLAGRTYLLDGSRSVLLLGTGALIFGVTYLLAGPLIHDLSTATTVHNSGVLLAGLFFLLSAVSATVQRPRETASTGRARDLALSYLGALILIGVVVWGAYERMIPDFFVVAKGRTFLRQVVLWSAVAEFLLAAVCLRLLYRRSPVCFYRWYPLGLALVGLGVLALALESSPGSPMSWLGRSGQYLGGLYMLFAILSLSRESWRIPLEKALHESEDRYRTLFELTPDLMILQKAGRIELINSAGARMLGGSCPDEFIGESVTDLVHPDDRELVKQRMAGLIDQSSCAPRIEERLIRLDGETVYVEACAVGVTFGGERRVLVTAHDIAARKHAEEAHAISAYVRELIEVSLDPLVTIGQDGRITDVNRATEDATGIRRDKLIGSDFSTYFTEPDKARAGYEQAFSNGFVRDYHLAIRHPSGRVIEVLYNATVYRDRSGDVIGVFAAARDVTDRNRVEQMERQVELEAHKLDFYRRTILAATGGKLVITESDEIDRIAGRSDVQWNLTAANQLRHIRAEAAEIAESAGMDSSGVHRLLTCVGEAASNAIKHADAGTVSLHRSDGSLIIRVEDSGSGIDALNLPDVALTLGFTTAGTGGLGYKMMIAAADRVYLATGSEGTTVAVELSLQADSTLPLDPAWP